MYWILNQSTQDNTKSIDQQGTGLGEDALPVDINKATEPTLVSDEETGEATAQTDEVHTSINQECANRPFTRRGR